ncbi:AP-4 complex subunit sigma-1 [Elysia marginata]|uniref:AP-4 complex subunit sigma-1 n=1 Tax=Elysia marginata TaxID=1093978 RepID=A0AAV4JU18_9GAST|nr:AP-4 complex subunit sigma-1 [Elysia marginata]
MINFFLIVNKQGRVRIRRNYNHLEDKERERKESLVIGEVLTRDNKQCNYFIVEDETVVYKRFTTLTLICGVSKDEVRMLTIFSISADNSSLTFSLSQLTTLV